MGTGGGTTREGRNVRTTAAGSQRVNYFEGDVAVTDFDAETARRKNLRIMAVALTTIVASGLAGCETSTSIFSSTPAPQVAAAPPPAPVVQPPLARIALAPVIGAPEAIAQQMSGQLIQKGEQQRVSLVKGADFKGDYTLRGYVVASRDKSTVKVSYIWDLTDPNGKRVNRIAGEEVTPAGTAKDPWTSVTGAVTQTIADKTSNQLATWLAANRPASAPVAAAPQPTSATPPPALGAPPPAQPAAQPVAAAPVPATANPTSTASLGSPSSVAAVVPSVTGAPGDGSSALSSALQRELSRQGVTLADRPGSTYRIEGKVALGAAREGKQSIQIDWVVRDPQGKSLGTVSQKNEIPAGSLDGAWGSTADAAAGAAAQGILKLLPQPRSIN